MSQKDKEVNTLNKLKSFFFREKSAGGKSSTTNYNQINSIIDCLSNWRDNVYSNVINLDLLLVNCVGTPREQKIDTNLLREWEGLLQPHLPAPQRCRTLKELCESDRINRLEDVCKS